MKTSFTPGPWKVMPADSINAEKQPFNGLHWVTTQDAEVEFGHDPRTCSLNDGLLICEMRDRFDAQLVASAPQLLEALEDLLSNATAKARYISMLEGKDGEEYELPDEALDSPEMNRARLAIAKAKGLFSHARNPRDEESD